MDSQIETLRFRPCSLDWRRYKLTVNAACDATYFLCYISDVLRHIGLKWSVRPVGLQTQTLMSVAHLSLSALAVCSVAPTMCHRSRRDARNKFSQWSQKLSDTLWITTAKTCFVSRCVCHLVLDACTAHRSSRLWRKLWDSCLSCHRQRYVSLHLRYDTIRLFHVRSTNDW